MDRGTTRRRWLGGALALAGTAPWTGRAVSADYPTRPIRLVVPLAAGGPSDSTARVVAAALSRNLGQQIVIENRPGAEGAVGAEAVYNAPPDGYTLFWSSSGAMVTAALRKSGPYDPARFTPVALVGRFSLFLYTHPGVPARDIAELISLARRQPGALTIATSTFADALAAAQFQKSAGIELTRVPYKGAAQVMPDLLGGRITMAVAPGSAGLPHVKDGRLRALGVFRQARSPAAPDVPAMAEAGVAAQSVPWVGIFGPPQMPADIVDRLARETLAVLAVPEMRVQLEALAGEAMPLPPEGLTAYLNEDIERSRALIQQYRLME